MTNDSNQFLTPEESSDVDAALLSNSDKFLTRLTLSSLRLLQMIAQDYQCSIEDLNHKQVIQWFEKDAKIRKEQGKDAATLKW